MGVRELHSGPRTRSTPGPPRSLHYNTIGHSPTTYSTVDLNIKSAALSRKARITSAGTPRVRRDVEQRMLRRERSVYSVARRAVHWRRRRPTAAFSYRAVACAAVARRLRGCISSTYSLQQDDVVIALGRVKVKPTSEFNEAVARPGEAYLLRPSPRGGNRCNAKSYDGGVRSRRDSLASRETGAYRIFYPNHSTFSGQINQTTMRRALTACIYSKTYLNVRGQRAHNNNNNKGGSGRYICDLYLAFGPRFL
ncbi:hypothetical protein EVAR_37362_1 [Eumeta japonica]|uniref:Uncharacterized protein n=1 Tax=Eumeta variegata TaxID=151549 RepID=A0A4C1X1U1_EUMVA|nr:hypothetical protein EVAR_37362_1 [Eumeta japonica]